MHIKRLFFSNSTFEGTQCKNWFVFIVLPGINSGTLGTTFCHCKTIILNINVDTKIGNGVNFVLRVFPPTTCTRVVL